MKHWNNYILMVWYENQSKNLLSSFDKSVQSIWSWTATNKSMNVIKPGFH
jgi:hypothetical protein